MFLNKTVTETLIPRKRCGLLLTDHEATINWEALIAMSVIIPLSVMKICRGTEYLVMTLTMVRQSLHKCRNEWGCHAKDWWRAEYFPESTLRSKIKISSLTVTLFLVVVVGTVVVVVVGIVVCGAVSVALFAEVAL